MGIESLIIEQLRLVPKVRKFHVKTLLQKQYEQRSDDPAESLADVARNSSFKSLLHARDPAAIAVQK